MRVCILVCGIHHTHAAHTLSLVVIATIPTVRGRASVLCVAYTIRTLCVCVVCGIHPTHGARLYTCVWHTPFARCASVYLCVAYTIRTVRGRASVCVCVCHTLQPRCASVEAWVGGAHVTAGGGISAIFRDTPPLLPPPHPPTTHPPTHHPPPGLPALHHHPPEHAVQPQAPRPHGRHVRQRAGTRAGMYVRGWVRA
jgi:hypothetical protein